MMNSFLKPWGLNCLNFCLLFRRVLAGDFLVALPFSKASSTLVGICYDSWDFYFISILSYIIMQMSEFHLAEIYKLFISILRNIMGIRVRFGAPLTGLNSPSSVFATARSKAVPPYVSIICFLSILYANCMFVSCLFCVIIIVLFVLVHLIGFVHLFKVSIVTDPCPNLLPLFLSLCPLLYSQFAVRSLCTFVPSPFFVSLAPSARPLHFFLFFLSSLLIS